MQGSRHVSYNRDRRRRKPRVVSSRPCIYQKLRTAKETSSAIGYEIYYLEHVQVVTEKIASIDFDCMVPATDKCDFTDGAALRRDREKQQQPAATAPVGAADEDLFFVVVGNVLEKDFCCLKRVDWSFLELITANPPEMIATVSYTSPVDVEESFIHRLHIVSPNKMPHADVADAIACGAEWIVPRRREQPGCLDFRIHSTRIAMALVCDGLEHCAARIFKDMEEAEGFNVFFRKVEVVALYEAAIAELQEHISSVRQQLEAFSRHWREKLADESQYFTAIETQTHVSQARDVFYLASEEVERYVEGINGIIEMQMQKIEGVLRRRKMLPEKNVLWAFRYFDTMDTGNMFSPFVRSALHSLPQLETCAEVSEVLLLMGKVPNTKPFTPSVIPYAVMEK